MTLSEISEKLGVPVNTLRQRITRLGIKPLTQEAVYSPEVLGILKDVKMGRPKKAKGTAPKPKEKPPKPKSGG